MKLKGHNPFKLRARYIVTTKGLGRVAGKSPNVGNKQGREREIFQTLILLRLKHGMQFQDTHFLKASHSFIYLFIYFIYFFNFTLGEPLIPL